MRVFAIKAFDKWASKNGISEADILMAVHEIENGLIDAKLGGNILKKRIATKGRGKRQSSRTILAYLEGKRAFFLYGFEKADKGNISKIEKQALQKLGNDFLQRDDNDLQAVLATGAMVEYKE